MENEEQISRILEMTGQILKNSPEYFVVEVRIRPTGNVKIFIDGDNGVDIRKLTEVNRFLYRQFLDSGLFQNDEFSLEVSSPGLEEPLRLLRQYRKNIGRRVEVELEDGSVKEGILMQADESGISLEMSIGKQKIRQQVLISFDQIRHTRVSVVFKN
ncbi:MAG TPA: hypothetical protein VNE41_03965 [Chitinophagaceae bacterium]|nr:hypothetical protein [Chitinophagaceae bacterium]